MQKKQQFLKAVAAAMEKCQILNVLVIYNIEGDLHNTTLAADPNTQASRFMDAFSDHLDDVLQNMNNTGSNG